jgi:hypothetical protein
MLQVFECSMASHGMNCDIVYLTTVCGALEACQAILEGGGDTLMPRESNYTISVVS